jgi:hypothetical protein
MTRHIDDGGLQIMRDREIVKTKEERVRLVTRSLWDHSYRDEIRLRRLSACSSQFDLTYMFSLTVASDTL